MRQIWISDITMKQPNNTVSLSFKEKIEVAKLLDKLGVSVIELDGIRDSRVDFLRIKSIASAVKDSILAVPVSLETSNIQQVWSALSLAKKPRMQVCAAVSSVQMEYLYHKKPEAMLEAISAATASCKSLCADVEFVAVDATRGDPAFLAQAVSTAIHQGATTVTVCDTAGVLMPHEMADFLQTLRASVPQLDSIRLGIACSNALSMADACVISAVRSGASEVKTAAYPVDCASLANVAGILASRGDSFDACSPISMTQLKRTVSQIAWMCETGRSKNSPFDNGVRDDHENTFLTTHDSLTEVLKVVQQLGYDLSEDDGLKVYEQFRAIAAKKEKVTAKELDAIVASAAMQVPPAYILNTYVITAGNTISATAHLKLIKNGTALEGVCIGDGPIDAAFLAIESITGHHYELDDFQIQAVTEGREAMGQTVVKLRSNGKLYSGKGISTDIVGASIHAYLSALNKIVFEEGDV